MFIPCIQRNPIRVVQPSTHMSLVSHLYHAGIPPHHVAGIALLEKISDAFASQDFNRLFQCRIEFDHPDGNTITVELHSANTQLASIAPGANDLASGYEPEVAALIDYFAGSEGTFLDIGANFGYFSLYLASRADYAGMIHAFEPSPRSNADLHRLITDAGLEDRIHAHDVALGLTAGMIQMAIAGMDGCSTLDLEMAAIMAPHSPTLTVPMRRLDDFMFDRVDVMKLDVEGLEADVLAGAEKTLEKFSPAVIFESWRLPNLSDSNDKRTFALLERLDYGFYLPCWIAKDGQSICTNIASAQNPHDLLLLRFRPAMRNQLPQQVNIVAMTAELARHIGEDAWLDA